MALGTMTQRTEGIRKQASELIEQAYQRGYKVGREGGYKDWKNYVAIDNKSFIEQGRNEAWEAARKITLSIIDGGLDMEELTEIFGVNTFSHIFKNNTASEAIEKIRAYEEQKKQEEDEEIKVGDEVIYNCGNDKCKATVIDVDVDVLHLLTENGCYISEKFKDVKKTNRNFSEIAEVLKKMKEE